MNVVNTGTMIKIFGDSLEVSRQIPVGTYDVSFAKMEGFFLVNHSSLMVKEEKIYGNILTKVEKTLRAFSASDRNFGVILSGKKGIGKSLFARLLSLRAFELKMPVLLVSTYYPGIADFLASIEQEIVVLFDEFEKTFAKNKSDDCDPQETLLSLIDGTDNGKKLFIITCNQSELLNNCFINRPGRFHYHFMLGVPTSDEICEYMQDKLPPALHANIDKLICLSMNIDITYDVLRAIAIELNAGYSLEEALTDLNIARAVQRSYNITVTLIDGTSSTIYSKAISPGSITRETYWGLFKWNGKSCYSVCFSASQIEFNPLTGTYFVSPENIAVEVDEDEFDFDKASDKARYEYLKNTPICEMVLVPTRTHADKYLLR